MKSQLRGKNPVLPIEKCLISDAFMMHKQGRILKIQKEGAETPTPLPNEDLTFQDMQQ